MSDIPAVIWNIRAVAVFALLVCTTHLTTQEEDEPDQERTGHHQWRRECGKVSEHTCPFLLAVARVQPITDILTHDGTRSPSAGPLSCVYRDLDCCGALSAGRAPAIGTAGAARVRPANTGRHIAPPAGCASPGTRRTRLVTIENTGRRSALPGRARARHGRFIRKRGFTPPRHGRIRRRVPRGPAHSLALLTCLQQRL